MSILVAVLTVALLAVVIAVVSAPLRAARARPEGASRERLAELEAAREAKYREIRDAELDFRTGKLSREDYEAVNGALRAEAVEILRALDALDALDAPARPRAAGRREAGEALDAANGPDASDGREAAGTSERDRPT